jgi:hypothetical protein
MGKLHDPESHKGGASLYRAFYGVGESLETIKTALAYKMHGFPFPAAISGRALNSWDIKKILLFLNQTLNFLIYKKAIYPSISLISVQVDSRAAALDVADKIKAIKSLRDEYVL